jgi:hypothetical protein
MHEKLLLNMYQASMEPKQEREKWKRDEEKKLTYGQDNCGKDKRKEPNRIPKSDWEK